MHHTWMGYVPWPRDPGSPYQSILKVCRSSPSKRIIFRFQYHSQKVIGSLELPNNLYAIRYDKLKTAVKPRFQIDGTCTSDPDLQDLFSGPSAGTGKIYGFKSLMDRFQVTIWVFGLIPGFPWLFGNWGFPFHRNLKKSPQDEKAMFLHI